jgi:hypothetical protein
MDQTASIPQSPTIVPQIVHSAAGTKANFWRPDFLLESFPPVL